MAIDANGNFTATAGMGGDDVLGDAVNAVERTTEAYENALDGLMSAANSGTMDLSTATAQTTNVQIQQGKSELVQGVAKAAADHVKGLGKKIG